MSRVKDITGQRFGRLTVIKRVDNYVTPSGNKRAKWLCRCDCGKEIAVVGHALRLGGTKSCGCLWRETITSMNNTHSQSKTRLYNIWGKMKARCYKPSNNRYSRYGGRGIKVCDEWRDNFQAFYDWAMANGYADNLSIDRIDVDGDYCPENCRWITLSENVKKSFRDRRNKQ